MTTLRPTNLALCAALFGLAACGSSSTGGGGTLPAASAPTPTEFNAAVAAAEGDVLAIVGDDTAANPGIPNTAFEAMPDAGTANFRGTGGGVIALSDDVDDFIAFVGDSRVTVDFGSEAITGGLSDIVAADPNANYFFVDGDVVLSNGDIGVNRPNDFTVDYTGALEIGTTTYAVGGTMLGDFHGTRVNNVNKSVVKAISATDETGIATAGGVAYDMAIGIFGSN